MDTHFPQQLKSTDRAPSKQSPEAKELDRPGQTVKPPSASSSPSHEFSFTISLHHSSAAALPADKTKPSPSPAVDLSPADDIFFHGHLLPLRLLSHLPISPRSSTNSLDSFTTLPAKNLSDDDPNLKRNYNISNSSTGTDKRNKPSRSLSFFGKWQKGSTEKEEAEGEIKKEKKRKMRFDMRHVLRRYARMVRPLLLFRGRKEAGSVQIRRQPHSFSGNLASLRSAGGGLFRGWRRGEFSAPASMRTSPTNSGLLLETATAAPTLASSVSDSTMEELQAAIQAAIAHCKNSINAAEELEKRKTAT